MRTVEERARLFRWTVEQVVEWERQVEAEVAAWPPLTARQRDRLRILLQPAVAKVAAERRSQETV